jgi:hypothetical protein
MFKSIPRLKLAGICIVVGALGRVLIAQVPPQAPTAGRAGANVGQPWEWPKTLEVYPSHPGDPIRLVRIMKGGKELKPGTDPVPDIAGDLLEGGDAVREWLKDVSFVLRNQGTKNIVSVGLAAVLPARETAYPCPRMGAEFAESCPSLYQHSLHWGRIPAQLAAALRGRHEAEGRGRVPLQGEQPLQIAPGQEVTLSLAGRGEGYMTRTDPFKPLQNVMNGILASEGIEVASGTEPCAVRFYSKTGCGFVEPSKFNIGIDIVYFEDGTIWGNYGYGYATPNSDGIYTRVETADSPGAPDPASVPN